MVQINQEHVVDLYVTNNQWKNIQDGKTFQVTFQQRNKNKPADHHIEVLLNKKTYTKLQRNIRKKRVSIQS
jgi:hypothetical protein